MYVPEQQGRAVSWYGLGTIVGPLIGPVVGGYVAQSIGWRWVCRLSAFFGFGLVIMTLLFLQESYLPIILQRQAKKHNTTTSPNPLPTIVEKRALLKRAILRPIKLLFSPILLLPCLGIALSVSIFYLLISTMAGTFQSRYNFSVGSSGLAYLGLGLGLILAVVILGAASDQVYKKIAKNEIPQPEIRLSPIIIGAPLACCGLLLYGWGIEKRTHWLLPILGTTLFGSSLVTFMLPVSTYLIAVCVRIRSECVFFGP